MNLSGKPLKIAIESAGYYSSMRIALLVQPYEMTPIQSQQEAILGIGERHNLRIRNCLVCVTCFQRGQ